jgi:hypothetical protein
VHSGSRGSYGTAAPESKPAQPGRPSSEPPLALASTLKAPPPPPLQAQQQLRGAAAAAESERSQRAAAETLAGHLRADLAAAQDSLQTLEKVYAQQVEALQNREASALGSLRVS